MLIWPLDPNFVRLHALRVYAQKQVRSFSQGSMDGVWAAVATSWDAVEDFFLRPFDGYVDYKHLKKVLAELVRSGKSQARSMLIARLVGHRGPNWQAG